MQIHDVYILGHLLYQLGHIGYIFARGLDEPALNTGIRDLQREILQLKPVLKSGRKMENFQSLENRELVGGTPSKICDGRLLKEILTADNLPNRHHLHASQNSHC